MTDKQLPIIPHRFIDRLLPADDDIEMRILIIGTFNPGAPIASTLSQEQLQRWNTIAETKKYKRFNLVRNFYDRPANRFWGIMDRLEHPALYREKGIMHKNFLGLKFFVKCDREMIQNFIQ